MNTVHILIVTRISKFARGRTIHGRLEIQAYFADLDLAWRAPATLLVSKWTIGIAGFWNYRLVAITN